MTKMALDKELPEDVNKYYCAKPGRTASENHTFLNVLFTFVWIFILIHFRRISHTNIGRGINRLYNVWRAIFVCVADPGAVF